MSSLFSFAFANNEKEVPNWSRYVEGTKKNQTEVLHFLSLIFLRVRHTHRHVHCCCGMLVPNVSSVLSSCHERNYNDESRKAKNISLFFILTLTNRLDEIFSIKWKWDGFLANVQSVITKWGPYFTCHHTTISHSGNKWHIPSALETLKTHGEKMMMMTV